MLKRVRSFLKEINENRIYQIIVFIVSMCAVLGLYAMMQMKVNNSKLFSYSISEDRHLANYIEEVKINDKWLEVSGWCFYNQINNYTTQIFLRNIDDNEEVIWLDVERVKRDDLGKYFGFSQCYEDSGFVARTKLNKLDLENKNYEILTKVSFVKEEIDDLGYRKEVLQRRYNITKQTGQFICNGKLTVLEPGQQQIQTASQWINEIIKQGVLLLYREDKDIYVYQCQDKLVWIAGERFQFSPNGQTYIQYQLDTSQKDRISKEQLEKGFSYDSLGFYFEDDEVIDNEFYPYRVAVKNIPEYPVICFWTGEYSAGWIWREYANLNVQKLRELEE